MITPRRKGKLGVCARRVQSPRGKAASNGRCDRQNLVSYYNRGKHWRTADR
jgi:hypothetical protein